jgi:hypothetical protein
MKLPLKIALATALFCGAMQGRADGDEKALPPGAPSRVSEVNGETVITLDTEARERSGIETAVPARTAYRRQLRGYATVLDPGPLTELGNRYAAAQAQLHSAQAKLAASQTAFERAQGLYRDGRNASLAELQAAEAAYRSDQARVSAARSEARSLAATAAQAWGPVLGASLVAEAPALARLIERRELLLQVTLPPGAARRQPPPHAALDIGGGRRAAIDLVSAAPRTDPRIQGLSFFYRVPAASGVLPGMQLLAYLPSGEAVAGAVVPAQAVVWWQDRAWIYRVVGPGRFARLRIATDQPAPGGGYVVADLPQGSEVVTRGAQLLLSEEFRAQIQLGD